MKKSVPPEKGFHPIHHRKLLTITLMLATIMQVLDTTIANVALPHMQGSLGATQDQITWVLTSYILSSAVVMTLISSLSNRWGKRRLFLISIVGFTLASIFCGIANSLEAMILYRFLQGIFGASFIPLSQTILLEIYPKEKHGYAFALWGMGIMIGPILGPILGGYLTDTYSWRWVFYINVPVGVLAFGGLLLFLKETPLKHVQHFDVKGFLLLSVFLTTLQLSLDRGEQLDWLASMEIRIELMLMITSLYFFVAHSLTTKHPFFNSSLFKNHHFMMGIILGFSMGAILQSSLTLTPNFLQNLMNYPVFTSGLIMVPRGIGTLMAMVIVGKLVEKMNPSFLLSIGFVTTALSLKLMTGYSPLMGEELLIISGGLLGFGLGFIFVPLSTLTFSTLMPNQHNEASGLYNLTRNIGGSLGISIMESFLTRSSYRNHAYLTEFITPYNKTADIKSLSFPWNPCENVGLAQWDNEITNQAEYIAYLNSFKVLSILALVCVVLLLLIKKQPILKNILPPNND